LSDLPEKADFSDFLITNITVILSVAMACTICLGISALGLQIDNSGLSYDKMGSAASSELSDAGEMMDADSPIFFAVHLNGLITAPGNRQAVLDIKETLAKDDQIARVVAVTDFDTDAVKAVLGIRDLWTPATLSRIRTLLPGMAGLVSKDLTAIGFAVLFKEKNENGFTFGNKVNRIRSVILDRFPQSPACHVAGFPVLKAAFERYNLKNTATYTLLGLLIGTMAAFYIFKSLRVSLLVTVSCAISTSWTIGMMALLSIKLTVLSGISLCFIIIVSTTTVMHMVSTYYELTGLKGRNDIRQTLKQTLKIVSRPCFMCALTTAAGFASVTISPVRIIHDSGVLIAVGILCSFALSYVITIFVLLRMDPPSPPSMNRIQKDRVSDIVHNRLTFGFSYPGITLGASAALLLVLVVGAQRVEVSRKAFFPISSATREAKDMTFFSTQFFSGYPLWMTVAPLDGDLVSTRLWATLYQLEQRIKQNRNVTRIDSLSPLLIALWKRPPAGYLTPGRVFRKLGRKEESKWLSAPFVDQKRHRVRIMIHLADNEVLDTRRMVSVLGAEAEHLFQKTARISFGGQLVMYQNQNKELVKSQLQSLALALAMITVLMILQLGSIPLGLISLIPNVFPVLTIFGLMGYLNIGLDPLMIFAVIISFGLSVDDTIHFLTQLKRRLSRCSTGSTVESCLVSAYAVCARALFSTTAVLFISSCVFLFSSFPHVSGFGLLVASASASALFGDLLVMPALIIKAKPIQRLLSNPVSQWTDREGIQ
jgi:uncharacterized protein